MIYVSIETIKYSDSGQLLDILFIFYLMNRPKFSLKPLNVEKL